MSSPSIITCAEIVVHDELHSHASEISNTYDLTRHRPEAFITKDLEFRILSLNPSVQKLISTTLFNSPRPSFFIPCLLLLYIYLLRCGCRIHFPKAILSIHRSISEWTNKQIQRRLALKLPTCPYSVTSPSNPPTSTVVSVTELSQWRSCPLDHPVAAPVVCDPLNHVPRTSSHNPVFDLFPTHLLN